jgi:acyl-coenzyme A synthetase/AMP-(fatty) acid ligase
MRDADGYFWFVGRADDVIKSAGHLIGPFEVESALMEHPAVAEAGVIGKPDPMADEIVKAFISLKPGFEAGEPLARELLGHARKRLGPAVAPKEIAFSADLPRTRSGKIMRRLLRARELALPEGTSRPSKTRHQQRDTEGTPALDPVPGTPFSGWRRRGVSTKQAYQTRMRRRMTLSL